MVMIHELQLGATFEDLLVEIIQVEGEVPGSKARDPCYKALVCDSSGFATLVYRSSNQCKPSAVKRGRVFTVSGRVTCHAGHLQLQVGSSWGRLERVNGQQVACRLAQCVANNVSAPHRLFGCCLLREDTAGQTHAYLVQPASWARLRGTVAEPECPFPCLAANYVDTERSTAVRSAVELLRVLPSALQLLTVGPAVHMRGGDPPMLLHLYAAQLHCEEADLGLVVGENIGSWVPLDQLLSKVSPVWAPTTRDLLSNLQRAAAAGMTAVAVPTGAVPAILEPVATLSPSMDAAAAAAAAEVSADAGVCADEGAKAHDGGGVFGDGSVPTVCAGPTEESSRLLPVTVLSGFLGSGKTTLLRHILHSKEGLRCAVIVNDMAELNVDASLVRSSKLMQAEEAMVEMGNGCICCTLRPELLKEVAELAARGAFDYLLIESTGISEPMQVAEAFAMQVDDEEDAVSLRDITRLDTCVTVVDAAQLLPNINSLLTLKELDAEAAKGDADEAERSVSDLLMDQIEFADVILLNKIDTVTADQVARLVMVLHALNPDAEVLPTQQSQVDLHKVINTGRFSFQKAQQSAGWLQALNGGPAHTPETEEYGISHFVFRSRRPFHPIRLHQFLTTHFVLQEPDWSDTDDATTAANHTADRTADHRADRTADHRADHRADRTADRTASIHASTHRSHAATAPAHSSMQSSLTAASGAALGDGDMREGDYLRSAAQSAAAKSLELLKLLDGPTADGTMDMSQLVHAATAAVAAATTAVAALANVATSPLVENKAVPGDKLGGGIAEAGVVKAALRESAFGAVLRSKGFAWLATRADHCAEWSQAGNIMRLGTGGPWYCVLPRDAWPSDEEALQSIEKDMLPDIGDRRQELVFIGIDMKREALTFALEACLCTDEELEQGVACLSDDLFAPWPDVNELLHDDEDDGQDPTQDGHVHGPGCSHHQLDHTAQHKHKDQPEHTHQHQHRHRQDKQFALQGMITNDGTESGQGNTLDGGGVRGDEGFAVGGTMEGRDAEAPAVHLDAVSEEGPEEADGKTEGDGFEPWQAGQVLEIMDGGAQMSWVMNELPSSMTLLVCHWYAGWVEACRSASDQARLLAARHPMVAFVQLDVEGSYSNTFYAMEQVAARPVRRDRSKLVLKNGGKWPCFTFHRVPCLQPETTLSGPTTLVELRNILREHSESLQGSVLASARPLSKLSDPTKPSPKGSSQSHQGLPASSAPTVHTPVPNMPALESKIAGAMNGAGGSTKNSTADSTTGSAGIGTSSGAGIGTKSGASSGTGGSANNGVSNKLSDGTTRENNCTSSRTASSTVNAQDPAFSIASGSKSDAKTSAGEPLEGSKMTQVSKTREGSKPTAKKGTAQVQGSVTALKKGAAQLKALLQDAQEQQQSMLLVWVSETESQSGACRSVLEVVKEGVLRRQDVRGVVVDVDASASNGKLAAAMKVQSFPAVQIYQGMKLQHSLTGSSASILQSLAKLANLQHAATTSADPQTNKTAVAVENTLPDDTSTHFPSTSGADTNNGTKAPGQAGLASQLSQTSQTSQTGNSSMKGDEGAGRAPSIWDPPPGKAGTRGDVYKVFPKVGRAIYWPRMPCLRCGCPWWIGEDWDADCARCGWDCAEDGYDDESNPEPAYKAAYKKFTAAIKEGYTLPWSGGK